MPFLKHNDPSSPVADANDSSHKCLWVALPNAELNKQLRACTQAFAEWTGVDPSMGFKYRDMVAWTAEFAGIASDMRDGDSSTTHSSPFKWVHSPSSLTCTLSP